MPRGRLRQTPGEAKKHSETKILSVLENSGGLRFSQLKELTGLHQDTLSNRLPDLISGGHIEYNRIGRLYRISEGGRNNLFKRELIELVEESEGSVATGGPKSSSSLPAEDVVLKSTVGYAFPAVYAGIPGGIKNVVHKYFVLHLLHWLVRKHRVDPRSLIGGKPLEGLVNELRKNLKERKQVLAFVVDLGEVAKRLNTDYLREILRLARIEDASKIMDTSSRFMETFKRNALDVEALEFLKGRGRSKLEDVAKHIKLKAEDARDVLDRLLIATGSLPEQEVHTPRWRMKVRVVKGRQFLRKIVKGSTVYYELA